MIPNFESVNLLDEKDQHHYLKILATAFNDHRGPEWGRHEDCRWRLKCFESKYCAYSPFAELKQ